MITFHLNNKKYVDIPESYNECTGKQLVAIAGLFEKSCPELTARMMALKILLGTSSFSFALITADAKVRMLQYVEWVFEKNTLTNQVLPLYRGFVGPKGEFDNLTLAEFHFAERYYRELTDEAPTLKGEVSAIDKLVAVLYRKPKPRYNYNLDSDGDARQRFNANETDHYASVIRKWPMGAKLAVLFFYDGCRQKLLEDYDEIFKGDSGEDSESGMFDVIRGIAEGGKYGDFDKVELMNIHTALLELSKQLKEAKAVAVQS